MIKDVEPKDLPLAGVRVIEFCTTASGPYGAMLLADMGAEVIKVEPPGGDSFRQWPPLSNGFSENFLSVNRNKRSVVLNLKDAADLAIARHLILDADVVLENNRPGVMQRLGLGYESFKSTKPGLIYCSISAYGQDGPRSNEGGFDLTIQAAAAVMSVTGTPGGEPVKCGVPIVDFSSGLYAAYAITSVLVRVRAGGAGAHIDVPMFGCTLGVAALQTSEYFGTGKNPRKLGSAHPRNAPYQAFRAKDGYFAIAAGNQRLWEHVVEVVQMPRLLEDPRFKTTSDRAANQAALKDLLEAHFAHESVAHWIAAFDQAGVPHAKINAYSDALADPQTIHMGWVRDVALPSGVKTRTLISPVRLDGCNLPIRRGPPALGADDESVKKKYRVNAR